MMNRQAFDIGESRQCPTPHVFWWIVGFAAILLPMRAHAIPVEIIETATYRATSPDCFDRESLDGQVRFVNCVNTGHVGERNHSDPNKVITALSGDDANFKHAFDDWNTGQGGTWTLASGGALPGGEIHVTTFDVSIESFSRARGNVGIDISWTYTGNDRNTWMWVQGIQSNFTTNGGQILETPVWDIDAIATADCGSRPVTECEPFYPTQPNGVLSDLPGVPFPTGFIEAWTMLAKVNLSQNTITAYEGVNWGIALSTDPIPEPNTLLLVSLGMAMLTRVRRPAARLARSIAK